MLKVNQLFLYYFEKHDRKNKNYFLRNNNSKVRRNLRKLSMKITGMFRLTFIIIIKKFV